ncbi:unnamed protein product [Peronospora farinosa]|uniref:Uncharacterized protein n=1 Tax=Peronospora farinosa TaxID=134698 RepID=A0ABN8BVG8_9STRA|nr:unnamed protein product [Peronospora farinosa]
MRNASTLRALHGSDSEQEGHETAPFLTHKGAKITDDEYGIFDVTGLSDEEDDSEEGGQILTANFTSEVRVLRMHSADADDVDSNDTGKHKRQKGKKKAKKDKLTVYRDAATIDDLIDVYAVYHRFAADAEEEGVDEEPRMEMNNEEIG